MNLVTFTLFIAMSHGIAKSYDVPVEQDTVADANGTLPIMCYYTYSGETNLTPEKIDPNLCSHIIIGFTSVVNKTVYMNNVTEDAFRRTVALKQKNPNMKVLFSIGGGDNVGGFGDAVKTRKNRNAFIESILRVLTKLDLDGVDIDWEFPSWFADIEDKPNFAMFLKEYRREADSRRPGTLLTVAVAAKTSIIKVSYDIESIALYVDYVNLMSYGFHDYKPFEDPFTGFSSPLFPRAVEKAYFSQLNMAFAAQYWIEIGLPAEKLLVGLPVYAHTYTLAVDTMNGVDAPAVGGGIDWSFAECCVFLGTGATRRFDPESLVPFAFKNVTWISYEDEQSLTYKAKWLNNQNFGGAMIFNLNSDDWNQTCGTEMFPLVKLIRGILQN